MRGWSTRVCDARAGGGSSLAGVLGQSPFHRRGWWSGPWPGRDTRLHAFPVGGSASGWTWVPVRCARSSCSWRAPPVVRVGVCSAGLGSAADGLAWEPAGS